jgi:hypothetical protein
MVEDNKAHGYFDKKLCIHQNKVMELADRSNTLKKRGI